MMASVRVRRACAIGAGCIGAAVVAWFAARGQKRGAVK